MPSLRVKPKLIGVNSFDDASDLEPNEASDALNVNLDRGTGKKRDGYVSQFDAGTAEIQGMLDFRRNDGTILTLVKEGDELHKWNGSVLSSLATGLSATELADFAVFGDRAYMVDGTNLKVTDGTTVHNAQIARPTATLTPTGVASGNKRGEYDYKWTYYSSTWGQESPASDATATYEVTGFDDENIKLAGFATSADTRVDTIRIYRRKVSVGETLWFLINEKAHDATDYTDDVMDVDVDLDDIAPLSYSDSLPGFRHIQLHAGVMFLAGDDDKLYFTLPDKPWSISNFIRLGGEGQYGKITGILTFQGLLFIFKEDSIWTLSGLTAESFHARPVVEGIGCHAGHSLVATENLIYFLGEDGFYAFNGTDAVKISRKIQDQILARNYSRDKYVVGVDDAENQSVIWSWSDSGSAANDKVSVFFYGNTQRNGGEQSWCPWQFDSGLTYAARITTDATTRDRKVWYGFANGVVGEPGGNDDNTAAITFYWRTGKIDGELPEFRKRWGRLHLETVAQTTWSYAQVRYYLDADTDHVVLEDLDPTDAIHYMKVGDRSRDLRLEFWQSDSQPFEIVSFVLEAQKAGRAA